jgi:hypothetical protein
MIGVKVDFLLGMKVQRDRERKLLKINHQRYVLKRCQLMGLKKVMKKFWLLSHTITYLAHWSRPDILYTASNLVSNYSSQRYCAKRGAAG